MSIKMKLFYSSNSPYARKCRVVILEKKLQNMVDMVSLMPSDNPPELIAADPLGTVPTLIVENGDAFCESPVICEYLDSVAVENPLFPAENSARFSALSLAALADGIMDVAVACVMEGRRPIEKQYDVWIERKEKAVKRTIAKIAKLEIDKKSWNIGTINVAVALEYVSFRLPNLDWKNEYNELSNWLDFLSKKASMQATKPVL